MAETVAAFRAAYATLGFEACANGASEDGFEKIALYVARDGRVKHAARLLSNGRWSSKLGRGQDIEHELEGLVGEEYGEPTEFLRRPVPR